MVNGYRIMEIAKRPGDYNKVHYQQHFAMHNWVGKGGFATCVDRMGRRVIRPLVQIRLQIRLGLECWRSRSLLRALGARHVQG